MREALEAVVHYAFTELDLSRLEAGCLPENAASRGVLEKTGFKYEGVAQSYLQSTDAGAIMCFTPISAMTGAGEPTLAIFEGRGLCPPVTPRIFVKRRWL